MPSSTTLEVMGYRAHATDTGDLLAVEVGFHLFYEYEEGAMASESTEIEAGVVEAPAGFAASLDPSHLKAAVRPEGGGVSEDLQVVLVPRQEAAENGSKVPEFGLVKIEAYAEENGNVEWSSAEAQKLVPLRNASASDGGSGSSSVATANAGASGVGAAPLAATALLAAAVGAAVGALAVRRFD